MRGGRQGRAYQERDIRFDRSLPVAQFWSQLTGFIEDADNGNAAEGPEALLLSPDGQLALLFHRGAGAETSREPRAP